MTKQFGKVLTLPRANTGKQDLQFVTALARGLEVLRAFQPEDGPLGNQELAERTKLPKSTVSRITHTLTTLGYLDYIPRLSKYAIAPSVLSLGHACVGAAGIRRAALPYMQELAEYADASVALGARDRLTMIYMAVARGSHTVAFSLDEGSHVPMHRSSMGAAFLHALPPKERDFLVDAIAKSVGKDWPATKTRLEQAFVELDSEGFCLFEGTYDRAINGVGTALVRPDGAIHSFSCSGPAFQFSPNRMRGDIGKRLVAMRSSISAGLSRGQ